jgi:hypothetical protein
MGFLDSVTKMLASGDASGIAAQAVRSFGGSAKTANLVGLVGKAVQDKTAPKPSTTDAPPATSADASTAKSAGTAAAEPVATDAKVRCFNRVALLNVAGWRDGSFSPGERLVLFRYIRDSADLDANTKIELLREIDRPPAEIQDFWQQAKANLSFNGLFGDQEQAKAFSTALEELVKADGSLDANEVEFVNMVKKTCELG